MTDDHSYTPPKLVPGISGTAAAFIDVSMILIMALLFAVAALKTHAPLNVEMQIAARQLQQGDLAPPLATLRVSQSGVQIDDGDLVPFAEIKPAIVQYADQDGEFGLCVSEAIDYHLVRNLIADVQDVAGPRGWTDCGGALR